MKMLKRVGMKYKDSYASKVSCAARNWPPKKIWQKKWSINNIINQPSFTASKKSRESKIREKLWSSGTNNVTDLQLSEVLCLWFLLANYEYIQAQQLCKMSRYCSLQWDKGHSIV